MRGTNFNPALLTLVMLLALAAGGCATQGSRGWFAGAKPKDEQRPHIKTPGERIEELRNLAADARKLPPAELERISTDLAHAIPKERDPLLRAQIIRTLALFPTETAARMLTAGLADTEADVRVAACEAWGTRGGPEAVERLSQTLATDADTDVRLAAARGLGNCPDQKTVAALGQVLEDRDPAVPASVHPIA